MKSRSRKDDAAARILRANGNPQELDKILQDECRRRAAKKLAATLLSAPDFRFPTALSAEQASADDIAAFHASLIPAGSKVADLTCGLGIDAFHIARRARSVCAIEMNPTVAEAIGHNAQALGLTNIEVYTADCREWIARQPEGSFDVVFIDPARRADDGSRLYSLTQCLPNVVELLPAIARISKQLLIKASPMLDISQCCRELTGVSDVYAVGTRAECKELLFDIRFDFDGEPSIHAATIAGRNCSVITKTEENIGYAETIDVGDTIGEPWPAVMKIHPRQMLSGQQLHPATFLYRSPADNFPGNRYEIIRIEPFSSSTIRRLAKEKPAASVAVRNFPISAEELRRRIKATESNHTRLIATTLSSGQQILLFLRIKNEKNS